MSEIKLLYLKLDNNYKIIEINKECADIFGFKNRSAEAPETYLSTILEDLPQLLKSIQSNTSKTLMLIKNYAKVEHSLIFLYMKVTKIDTGYIIGMVNWLNWIHQLYASVTSGYSFVSDLSTHITKKDFVKISDASCFKALYPLVTHVPSKFVYGINQYIVFDIMNLFVRQRSNEKCTKDYIRNVYSRLKTNLRKDYNLEGMDVIDTLFNDDFLNIRDGDNIYIPKTYLISDVISVINNDALLDSFINNLSPIIFRIT